MVQNRISYSFMLHCCFCKFESKSENLLLILKFSFNQIFSVLFGPHFIKVNINENNKFSLKLCYKKTS